MLVQGLFFLSEVETENFFGRFTEIKPRQRFGGLEEMNPDCAGDVRGMCGWIFVSVFEIVEFLQSGNLFGVNEKTFCSIDIFFLG